MTGYAVGYPQPIKRSSFDPTSFLPTARNSSYVRPGADLMANWRAAYRRQAGGLGQAHIAVYGDSVADGFNGALRRTDGWVGKMTNLLTAHTGQPVGTGMVRVYGVNGVGGEDRIALAGTWANSTVYGYYNNVRYTLTGTDTLTFADQTCEKFRIHYLRESGSGAEFTYAVDGGSATSVPATASPSANLIIDVPVGDPGVHSLVITRVSGTVMIIGVEAVWNSTRGIKVSQVAHGGAATTNLLLNNAGTTQGIRSRSCCLALAPDLAMFWFGLNDCTGSTFITPQVFEDNLNLIIDLWTAVGSSVLLGVCPPLILSGATNRDYRRYAATIRRVAQLRGTGFIDCDAVWRSRDNSLPLYDDTVHPTAAGHTVMAGQITDYVIAASVSR